MAIPHGQPWRDMSPRPLSFELTGGQAADSPRFVPVPEKVEGGRERPGAALFKPLRQVIESINETFQGQLDLERHRGRTPGDVIARVMQRILALTAAIWHNDATGQIVLRSLIAYDHCPLDWII